MVNKNTKKAEMANQVSQLLIAWGLFEAIITKAKLECTPQIRKAKRMPAWLTSRGKEVIRSEEASFRKRKSFPNVDTKRGHKLWQNKCKQSDAKKLGKPIDIRLKTNNFKFFK